METSSRFTVQGIITGDDKVVHLPGEIKESGDAEDPTLIDGIAEVKCENIWEVIGKDKFKVNNLWDDQFKPREADVIVEQACQRAGRKLEFSWSTSNSEHFAKELRYGEQVLRKVKNVDRSAGADSQTPKGKHDAERGDLIEISRWGYEHWVVYIGEDKVVGLASPNEGDGVLTNMLKCEAEVKCENMWNVIGCDKFRVNNYWDDKHVPRKADCIVNEAKDMVGQKMPYRVLTYNCEHFATKLRYGEAFSKQIGDIVGNFVDAIANLASGSQKLNESENMMSSQDRNL